MSSQLLSAEFTRSPVGLDAFPQGYLRRGSVLTQHQTEATIEKKFGRLLEQAMGIESQRRECPLPQQTRTPDIAEKGPAGGDNQTGGHGEQDGGEDHHVKELFEQFVTQTFFGLLLKEMRKSIHKTTYFHGGLAEEIFEQHLDMAIAEKLAHSTGERFGGPMFKLFQIQQNRE